MKLFFSFSANLISDNHDYWHCILTSGVSKSISDHDHITKVQLKIYHSGTITRMVDFLCKSRILVDKYSTLQLIKSNTMSYKTFFGRQNFSIQWLWLENFYIDNEFNAGHNEKDLQCICIQVRSSLV